VPFVRAFCLVPEGTLFEAYRADPSLSSAA
jgi:hypothetical protein